MWDVDEADESGRGVDPPSDGETRGEERAGRRAGRRGGEVAMRGW